MKLTSSTTSTPPSSISAIKTHENQPVPPSLWNLHPPTVILSPTFHNVNTWHKNHIPSLSWGRYTSLYSYNWIHPPFYHDAYFCNVIMRWFSSSLPHSLSPSAWLRCIKKPAEICALSTHEDLPVVQNSEQSHSFLAEYKTARYDYISHIPVQVLSLLVTFNCSMYDPPSSTHTKVQLTPDRAATKSNFGPPNQLLAERKMTPQTLFQWSSLELKKYKHDRLLP